MRTTWSYSLAASTARWMRVGSPDGAIPSDIRSRGGDMDVREEELQRVLAKVGWNCRSRDRILPLGAHVLRPSGEAIIRHQQLDTLAQRLVGAVARAVGVVRGSFARHLGVGGIQHFAGNHHATHA